MTTQRRHFSGKDGRERFVPAGPEQDLAYALVVSRVLRPASKLSTISWWQDVTLGGGRGPADDVYAAVDWLAALKRALHAMTAAAGAAFTAG